MRDGIAGADQGIARFDKPDGGFWRRVVRGLMKCIAPGVDLAAVIECQYLSFLSPRTRLAGFEFINMLMNRF